MRERKNGLKNGRVRSREKIEGKEREGIEIEIGDKGRKRKVEWRA